MSTARVSLLSYGVGNLGSVRNMFRRLGVTTTDVTAPEQVRGADRLLLPGVGSFDHGMGALERDGWVDAIREHVGTGRPLLGICLGMQLLLDSSEEGVLPGLGFVPGRVLRFPTGAGLRIPHMGWSHARPAQESPLFHELDEDARFYFVHSYYAAPAQEEHVLARSDYGTEFASAVVNNNVYGTQFHPEKSHRFGMRLLENFSRL